MVAGRRFGVRVQLAVIAAAFSSLTVGSVRAQDPILANVSPPAEQMAMTPGGVDFRSGRYHPNVVDVSIGEDSAGGLELQRKGLRDVGSSPFANFSHNWDITISERRFHFETRRYTHGGSYPYDDYRLSVRFNGIAESFDSWYIWGGTFSQVSNANNAVLTVSGDRNSASAVYTFRAADGTILIFRPIGSMDCESAAYRCAFVSQIDYPDGTRLSFEYEDPTSTAGNTRLKSVVSSRGYALLFEQGTNGYVSKVCAINLSVTSKPTNNLCPSGALASSYTYTSFSGVPYLASATNAAGATSQFSYSAPPDFGVQMAMTKPGHSQPWLTNRFIVSGNINGEFKEQTYDQSFATGEHYVYSYFDPSGITSGAVTEPMGGFIDGPNSQQTTLEYGFIRLPRSMWANPDVEENLGDAVYQTTPGPIRIVDPLGRETSLDYCDPFAMLPPTDQDRCIVSLLQNYTDPEGIKTVLSYDGARNVVGVRRISKPGSGLPDIVTSATYACGSPKSCTKPATLTDARGAVTNYTYDAAHGGLLTAMQPAPAAGGARPLVVKTYAQKYAYVLSGASLVPAATPVWMPTTETECQTAAGSSTPVCDGGAAQKITTFEYGANGTADNLLLRGIAVTADGVTLRTCYGYDAQGRKISETKPNANLSVCP